MVKHLPALQDFGRYELLGRLAVGGMAEIYLAREPENVQGAGHRHLVIKRVLQKVADNPAFAKMFFEEARLAVRLNHPAIVHLYEFGEEEGSYFLAMEWVDGVALGKLIRKAREAGGVPPPIAVKLIAIVAEALHYAHHLRDDDGAPLNIVHRDVSPQNIMISNDGAVKLLDFGIAKSADQDSATEDGQVKGKFAYMSPQQCTGDPIDGRADIFSLGVVLYETLTGLPLYHRKTQYETMRSVLEDRVPSLLTLRPDLPVELDEVLQRCLAKEPEDRFATAGDLQIALESWLAKEGEVVPPPRITEFLSSVLGDRLGQGPMVDSTPFGRSFQELPDARLTPPPGAASALVAKNPRPPMPELPIEIEEAPSAENHVMTESAPPSLERHSPPAPSSAEILLSAEPLAPSAVVTGKLAAESPIREDEMSNKKAFGIVALLLLLLCCGGAFFWFMFGRPDPVAENVPPQVGVTPVTPVGVVPGSDPVQPTPVQPTPVQPTPVEPGENAGTQEATPEQPDAPAMVRVPFGSEPSGATVRIDGTSRGVTPLTLELAPGTYTVELSAEGRRTHRSELVVTEGMEAPSITLPPRAMVARMGSRMSDRGVDDSSMDSTMESAVESAMEAVMDANESAGPGTISINTRPWSKVYVGGRLLGTTPIGRESLPAGTHRLRFVDRDGAEHNRTVRVESGEDSRAFFDFAAADSD